MAAPVLAETTLAYVSANKGFSYSVEYRGSMQALADGTVQTDLVSDTKKRTFVMTWKNITTAQKNTIEGAFHAIRKASGAFTAPDGQTATVTRSPQQKDLKWDTELKGDGSYLWSTSMTLVEV
jgi:hypothetical protein